jgi:cell division protein FtsB
MGTIIGFFTGYDTLIALGLAAIAVVVFVASRVGVLPKKSIPVAVGALLGLLGLSIWQTSRRRALQQQAKEIKDRIAERDKEIARLENKYRDDRTALDSTGALLNQQLAAHERELERSEAKNREERAAIERMSDDEIFEAAHRRQFH